MKNNIKKLSLAAILAALCTTLLIISGIIDILDMTAGAVCSLIIAASIYELGGKYPILIYAASSVLTFIFMPFSTSFIYFAFFFGYYPILRRCIVKIKRPVSKIISFVFFNGVIAAIFFIFKSIFASEGDTPALMIALLIAANIFFVCYEFILENFQILYLKKLRAIFNKRS